jgi:hypothetical protein
VNDMLRKFYPEKCDSHDGGSFLSAPATTADPFILAMPIYHAGIELRMF